MDLYSVRNSGALKLKGEKKKHKKSKKRKREEKHDEGLCTLMNTLINTDERQQNWPLKFGRSEKHI